MNFNCKNKITILFKSTVRLNFKMNHLELKIPELKKKTKFQRKWLQNKKKQKLKKQKNVRNKLKKNWIKNRRKLIKCKVYFWITKINFKRKMVN